MSILHKEYHVPLIRAGEKTVTRRLWHPDYPRPLEGSIRGVETARYTPIEDIDCFVEIMDVYREPLGAMTDADARMEGEYESVEEFRERWLEINGPGTWRPEDPSAVPGLEYTPMTGSDGSLVVDVVQYEYVGRRKPEGTSG